MRAAAKSSLAETETRDRIQVEMVPRDEHVRQQASPGRPGRHTRYVRRTTTVYEPVAVIGEERLRATAAADGVIPWSPTCPATK